MTDEWRDRITVDAKILRGKPIIAGTRISVEFILELLAEGWTTPQIPDAYPQLTPEDINAAIRYAHSLLQQEEVYPYP